MAHPSRRLVLSFFLFAGFALFAHAQVEIKRSGESDGVFLNRKIGAQAMADQAARDGRTRTWTWRTPCREPIRDRRPHGAAPRRRYIRRCSPANGQVLVVPFQVQDRAFSRDLRWLMTAQLAGAMAAAGAKSMPDPYLVARALGDGERGYDLMEVFGLANKLGAKRIVAAYAGHNVKKPNTMRVTLHYYDLGDQQHFWETFLPRLERPGGFWQGSSRLNARHFDDLRFDDERTPIDAVQSILPDMIKFLGMTPAQGALVRRLVNASLPATPLGLASAKPEPARDSNSQLLAALTPAGADRARERLNEKSMLALLQMSPQSPDYRALKARALMNMGLRPAALRVLGEPSSAEEEHLAALLDGNLPQVQANRPKMAPGVRAFVQALEENEIAAAYGARTQDRSLALSRR